MQKFCRSLASRTLAVLFLCAALVAAFGAISAHAHTGVFLGEGSFLGHAHQLSTPKGIALSSDGATVFIVDSDNDRILKASSDGSAVELFAGAGRGNQIDPNSATNTQLNNPTAIAVSLDGATVFIADTYNNRILKASSDGSAVELFAGAREGDQIDPNSAANTELRYPTAIALSPDGARVFIADWINHRILKASSDGSSVELFAGAGRGNQIDPNSATNTQLNYPRAIALTPDGASVFIADSDNHRILKASSDGSSVELFAGAGEGDRIDPNSAANTELRYLSAIALSPDGASVFVADAGNDRILKASSDGSSVKLFAGAEGGEDRIDPNSAANTELNLPTAIALSPDGASVLIVDSHNNRILLVGGDDEYEVGLGKIISTGLMGAQVAISHDERVQAQGRRELLSAVRDLNLLATANPLRRVEQSDGRFNSELVADTPWQARRLSFLSQIPLLRSLPQDLSKKIVAHEVDRDRDQPIRRLRAKLALDVLRGGVVELLSRSNAGSTKLAAQKMMDDLHTLLPAADQLSPTSDRGQNDSKAHKREREQAQLDGDPSIREPQRNKQATHEDDSDDEVEPMDASE